ncbi:MAG: GIY-YIG nuclease family protein [Defluviitaleaceae bacterium]|nr:GIY-YIG nuclease family protein [Defluviitaleaceae bacterium]
MPAYIYFMASKNNFTLYVGLATNLEERIWQHKNHIDTNSFATKYNCTKLVYFEEHSCIAEAIQREKQLKNWKREWKNTLVEKDNPNWIDLSENWQYH